MDLQSTLTAAEMQTARLASVPRPEAGSQPSASASGPVSAYASASMVGAIAELKASTRPGTDAKRSASVLFCEPSCVQRPTATALLVSGHVDEISINSISQDNDLFAFLAVACGKTSANRRDLNWLSRHIQAGLPLLSGLAKDDYVQWNLRERAAIFFERELSKITKSKTHRQLQQTDQVACEHEMRRQAAYLIERLYAMRSRVQGLGMTSCAEFLHTAAVRAQSKSMHLCCHISAHDALQDPPGVEELMQAMATLSTAWTSSAINRKGRQLEVWVSAASADKLQAAQGLVEQASPELRGLATVSGSARDKLIRWRLV